MDVSLNSLRASGPLKRRSHRNDQSPIEQVSFQDMLSSIQSVYSGIPQRLVK